MARVINEPSLCQNKLKDSKGKPSGPELSSFFISFERIKLFVKGLSRLYDSFSFSLNFGKVCLI